MWVFMMIFIVELFGYMSNTSPVLHYFFGLAAKLDEKSTG